MTNNNLTDERLSALIRVARDSLELYEMELPVIDDVMLALAELQQRRAAMLHGADGALTNEDTKRVEELVMWIKRLVHSLRKLSPDSKLQSDAMDYLSRKGLIGVEDILR